MILSPFLSVSTCVVMVLRWGCGSSLSEWWSRDVDAALDAGDLGSDRLGGLCGITTGGSGMDWVVGR